MCIAWAQNNHRHLTTPLLCNNMSATLPVLPEADGLATRRSSDLSPSDIEKQHPDLGTDIKRVPSSNDGSDRSLIDK